MPDIRVVPIEETTILGSPLFDKGIEVLMKEKSQELKRLTNRLSLIDAHEALFILKNCFSLPRLMYILRSAPLWRFPELLSDFDGILRSAVQNVTNTYIDEQSWIQTTLPVSSGGLGIRSSSQVALPAFLASTHASLSLVNNILNLDGSSPAAIPHMNAAWDSWNAITGKPILTGDAAVSQKAWDQPIIKLAYTQILQGSNDVESRARLLAVASRESGAWLHAIPIPSLGTKLSNDCVRIAVGLRLGTDICTPHKCICNAEIDSKGRHGLSCNKCLGRYPRHQEINTIIQRSLTSAGVSSILEPPGCARNDGRRPDGMTLFPWEGGRSLVWDATCVDTLAKSNLHRSALRAGAAADHAEILKSQKYTDLGDRYNFKPLGFETVGGWGPKTVAFMHNLGRKIKTKTSEPRSTSYLFQRLSIAIQRGNCASVLGAAPTSKPLDEIFFILT